MSQLVGIYGTGGCARDVYSFLKRQIGLANDNCDELVFIDDQKMGLSKIGGCRVMSYTDFIVESGNDKSVAIAISDAKIRRSLSEKLDNDGIKHTSLRASTALVGDSCQIGAGYILSDYTVITADIKIGRGFHANIYSCVTHDCVIGDFVTFAPAAKCNGNVLIGDGAYIGAGAIIRQGKTGAPLIIGEGAVIGMGAVVTNNVAPNTVVVGNPAKTLNR